MAPCPSCSLILHVRLDSAAKSNASDENKNGNPKLQDSKETASDSEHHSAESTNTSATSVTVAKETRSE